MTNHAQNPSIVSMIDGNAVTTTLAIAEGTDVEHKATIQLVRTYLADLEEFGRVTFEMRPFETAGGTQQREIALLNEQQATLILTYMRNSEIVRAFKKRLVKAFYELGQQAQLSRHGLVSLPTRLELIQIAMAAEQERLVLEEKVKVIQPKADALDRLSASEGSQCITDAAKALKMQPKKLFAFLQKKRWIYKRAGGKNWLGYQDKIQSGYIECKITTVAKSDGSEKTVEQALLTPKGMTKLAGLVNGGE